MFKISRITFENFKIFRDFKLDINENINIFVGDNGSGKSSILQGIELALSGSTTRVQNIGLENLINIEAINEVLACKDVRCLPRLVIEIYLSLDSTAEPAAETYYGENNKLGENTFGVKLVCEPREEYMSDIKACLCSEDSVFPYELYNIYHQTFKGDRFNPYRKPLESVFINSSEISSKYALASTVKATYISSVTDFERAQNRQRYKNIISQYEFVGQAKQKGICISSNLEDNLSIEQNGVYIENLGQGEINIIKTTYALNRLKDNTSIVCLEEPETHLTHSRMRKMLHEVIQKADRQQIFVATHSSQIVARLGLDNVFFIANNAKPTSLKNLDIETADFFRKAPSDSLLQFILAKKVILVEGAAEFILMEHFYEQVTGNLPEEDNVWIISINGVSFRRYLQVSKLIGNKVAVIRDNDGSCKPRYTDFCGNNIHVFTDKDEINRNTFEKCIYEDNKELCEKILRQTNTLSWMLNNKSETAYRLLSASGTASLIIPLYIREAILWVRR